MNWKKINPYHKPPFFTTDTSAIPATLCRSDLSRHAIEDTGSKPAQLWEGINPGPRPSCYGRVQQFNAAVHCRQDMESLVKYVWESWYFFTWYNLCRYSEVGKAFSKLAWWIILLRRQVKPDAQCRGSFCQQHLHHSPTPHVPPTLWQDACIPESPSLMCIQSAGRHINPSPKTDVISFCASNKVTFLDVSPKQLWIFLSGKQW